MQHLTNHLRIPGPTPLPDPVREAGGRQMINHRSPEFAALFGRITARLQTAFRTSNEILLLTTSGTGGLEAAIVNHLSPGDPVLAVSIGAFGDRFAKIASRFGADVTKLDAPWGTPADPQAVSDAIGSMVAAGRTPRAVLLTHNETSTGVTNPIDQLSGAVHAAAPHALVIVDGISGVGALPFETDAWGLDVVVTGSQKSWMAPPGLAMLCASERAWAAQEQASMPRFYFDLREHRASAAKGATPWTPAVGVCFALDAALEMLEAEGSEAVFARHAACGAATRAGVQALGFDLLADPRVASNTVTAVKLPQGLEWKTLNADLRARGLVIAGGQGALTGKVFRIGHLGAVTVDEIIAGLAILEETLAAEGRPVERGAALTAAARAADTVLANAAARAAAQDSAA